MAIAVEAVTAIVVFVVVLAGDGIAKGFFGDGVVEGSIEDGELRDFGEEFGGGFDALNVDGIVEGSEG